MVSTFVVTFSLLLHIMKHFLQKLGLEDKEIDIYLTCLKHTFNNPTALSRETGIKRSTLYFYLEKLKEKGLVGYQIKKKKKYIIALPFKEAFGQTIELQKEKISEQEKIVQHLLPLLEKETEVKNQETKIDYYEGQTGVNMAIYSIIEAKTDIHWIGSITTILSAIKDEKLYKRLTLERLKHNTTSYAITDKRILAKKHFSEQVGIFRQFQFFEKDFDTPAVICIFSNTVILFSATKNNKIKTVIIKDDIYSEMFKFLFWSLWNKEKK